MKQKIASKLSGWAPVTGNDEYLKYDWVIVDDEHEDDDDEHGIKLDFASNNVRLGNYAAGSKKVDTKECRNGWYIIDDGGCEECRGDENYSFDMERRLEDGSLRLKVQSYVSCRCGGGRYDEDSDHCEEMYYIAVPRGTNKAPDVSKSKGHM